MTPANLLLI